MKIIKEHISQSELKLLFNYNNADGRLYWKERPSNRVNVKLPAGRMRKDGYVEIKINGESYLLHRLNYIFHNGDIRTGFVIDHISGNNSDNRIENLQEISQKENIRKQKLSSKNNSGYRGVNWDKNRRKLRVQIMVDKKRLHLGFYSDIEEAAKEYNTAATLYFGEYAQLNNIN